MRTKTQRTHQDLSKVKFHAILVFHDPRNWGLDIQVMCDILRGNGFLAEPTSDTTANDVEVVFCNPDLLWKNECEGPRLGQGGFRKAWESVWSVGRMVSPPYVHSKGQPPWTACQDGPKRSCYNPVRKADKGDLSLCCGDVTGGQ